MLSSGELYVLAAPSGAGKTSLMRALLEREPRLALSISDTTRPARRGEVDGQQYHFVDLARFKLGVVEGRYLEYADVFGNYYGTSREQVQSLWNAGRDVLLEIDVQGAAQIRRRYPEACTIFILPPSMEELAQRLVKRGLDEPEVIKRRLGEARREIEACSDFHWMVINDDFDQALDQIQAIVTAWPQRRARQVEHVERLISQSDRPQGD